MVESLVNNYPEYSTTNLISQSIQRDAINRSFVYGVAPASATALQTRVAEAPVAAPTSQMAPSTRLPSPAETPSGGGYSGGGGTGPSAPTGMGGGGGGMSGGGGGMSGGGGGSSSGY